MTFVLLEDRLRNSNSLGCSHEADEITLISIDPRSVSSWAMCLARKHLLSQGKTNTHSHTDPDSDANANANAERNTHS